MRITTKVNIDTSVWKDVVKNIKTHQHDRMRYGWFDSVHSSGFPTAQIAKWNEEGHKTGGGGISPPRPMIRVGAAPKVEKLVGETVRNSLTRIVLGDSDWKEELERIGQGAEKILKKEIEDWTTPPNRPLTIKLKGFNDPLIDTGQMLDQVTYRVGRLNEL